MKSGPMIVTILPLVFQEKRIKDILALPNFQGLLGQEVTNKNHLN